MCILFGALEITQIIPNVKITLIMHANAEKCGGEEGTEERERMRKRGGQRWRGDTPQRQE